MKYKLNKWTKLKPQQGWLVDEENPNEAICKVPNGYLFKIYNKNTGTVITFVPE